MGTHPIFESDFDCLTDMWRSSKLWSIEYQDGDLIGKLLCHISMLAVIQPFVAVAMALAGSKRGARLAVGLVVATVVCRCLKMVINSPRPDAGHLVHPGNSGFPSDHSLSCKYWQNSELVLAVPQPLLQPHSSILNYGTYNGRI